MQKKVLFIAPHPDDETLGCGGTILKHKHYGDSISWLIMTSMFSEDGYTIESIDKRKQQIKKVSQKYQFDQTLFLDLPTTKLDVIPTVKIVSLLTEYFDSLLPEVIYVPFRNDIHSDHKITFDAVISASKSFRCPSLKKIMMYEVVSETEFAIAQTCNTFVPNIFSDISKYFVEKTEIIKLYDGEISQHPFPRSIENITALATFRGATSGCQFAEGFVLLKEIC